MKGFVFALFLLTLIVFGFPASSAYAAPLTFEISGHVINGQQGTPVADAHLKMYCRASNPSLAAEVISDVGGYFSATVSTAQCPLGSDVVVVAKWDGKTGGYHTLVRQSTVITIELGTPIPIPEYGMVGSFVALGFGIGSTLYVRRRILAKS